MEDTTPQTPPTPEAPQERAPEEINVTHVEHNEDSVGPIIGVIIILAALVLGGLYFWSLRASEEDMEQANNAETSALLEEINTQSSSDSTASIESDLENTDIDNLDAELNAQ